MTRGGSSVALENGVTKLRKSAETEALILEAATSLLAEGGVPALSMRVVAERVGLSATAIYHYFDGKDDLLGRVVRGGYQRFGEYLNEAMEKHPAGSLERVFALGDAYVRFAFENQEYFRVLYSIQARMPRDVSDIGSADFQLRVFFPRIFLNQHTRWGAEDPHRSTESHMCFVADSKTRAPGGLYPGDGMKDPLPIEYCIDDKLFNNPQAMQSEIRIELYSGSMKPKKHILPIRDFQKF